MPFTSIDCPHCRRPAAPFALAHSPVALHGGPKAALLICQVCGEPVVAKYPSGDFDYWANGSKTTLGVTPSKVWPKFEAIEVPAHIPPPLPVLYTQAVEALARKHADTAVPTFRRILETAIKRLDPEGTEKRLSLKARIDRIEGLGGITKDMAAWAHEIRELGNEGVHEDHLVDVADAEDLRRFVEMFLIYAFTMPERVRERREVGTGSAEV